MNSKLHLKIMTLDPHPKTSCFLTPSLKKLIWIGIEWIDGSVFLSFLAPFLRLFPLSKFRGWEGYLNWYWMDGWGVCIWATEGKAHTQRITMVSQKDLNRPWRKIPLRAAQIMKYQTYLIKNHSVACQRNLEENPPWLVTIGVTEEQFSETIF